jgi:hypothetical protein
MLICISKIRYLQLSRVVKFSRCQFTVCGQTRQVYVEEIGVLWWNFLSEAPNIHEAPHTLSVKLSDFTLWRHTWRKNWVICAVLTDNSAGLRTVLSSRLSHRELCSSLRESHSFLSLPADTTITSPQGTSVSSNSFSRWASHDIFLLKYHFLLHILRCLFFFSDNIMADVASKQQTTALFLSTIITHTRGHTELTKNWQTWWETCAVSGNNQFSFSCSFLYS